MFPTTLKLTRKSKYILDVSTNEKALKFRKPVAVRASRVFSKVAKVGLTLTVAGLAVASGFLVQTASAPAAHASDPLTGLLCSDADSYASLGGYSQHMQALVNATITDTHPSTSETAYEMYGVYQNFDSWTGASYDSGVLGIGASANFTGTGGKAKGTTVPKGFFSPVPDPTHSALYSHQSFECLSGNQYGSMVASILMWVPETEVGTATNLYSFAYDSQISNVASPLHVLGQAVSKLIVGTSTQRGLKDVLYLPFLLPVVSLGAIYLLYLLFKSKTTDLIQSVLWMVCGTAGGWLLLSQPMLIPNLSDTVVNAVTSSVNNAVLSYATPNALCALPSTAKSRITRETSCELWYTVVYTNWVDGQFGVTSMTGSNARQKAILTNDPRNILSNATITIGGRQLTTITWGEYELANQGSTVFNTSEIAYAQLSGASSTEAKFEANGTWAGNNASAPIGSAFLAGFAGAGAALVIGINSFLMVFYELTMLMLVILSPLFFLVGAMPGYGRRIAMRWVELVVGLVIKRVLLSLMLTIFLLFEMTIESLSLNYAIELLLLFMVAFLAVTQRKTVTDLFVGNIDFGGHKQILGNVDSKGGKFLAGITGAAIGALGAASGVGGKVVASMAGNVIAAGGEGGTTAPTAPSSTGLTLTQLDDDGKPRQPKTMPTASTVRGAAVKKEPSASDLRKSAIRKGAMRGAAHGYAAGEVGVKQAMTQFSTGAGIAQSAELQIVAKEGQAFRDQQAQALLGASTATQAQEVLEAERRNAARMAEQNRVTEAAADKIAQLLDENRRTANRIDRKLNDIGKQFPPKP
jgi:hypothetical protein